MNRICYDKILEKMTQYGILKCIILNQLSVKTDLMIYNLIIVKYKYKSIYIILLLYYKK